LSLIKKGYNEQAYVFQSDLICIEPWIKNVRQLELKTYLLIWRVSTVIICKKWT